MAKKPKIETKPDVVEELVRRTKVYLERYKGTRFSTENAAGLAWRDLNPNAPENPGVDRERKQHIRLVMAQIDGEKTVDKPAHSRRPPRNRYGSGNANAERALPKNDR